MTGLEVAGPLIAAATPTIISATPAIVDGVVATYALLKNKYLSFKNMKEIREELEKDMKALGDKRDKYKSTKMPSNIFYEWHCSVGDIEEEVKTIVTKSKKASRIKHGKYSEKMKKMANEVIELLEESDKFLADPERVEWIDNASNIKGIKSREEVLDRIVNLLKNNKVQRIGIHGTLGIGKTTIMQNLNNHAEVAKMFDIIIWLKLPTEESNKNFSREHPQNAIMRRFMQRLKLSIECAAKEMEVAKIISEKLEGKKYLLLLDDVNEELDLSQVGIPAPDGRNGCKMVLTARLPHVAFHMNVDRWVKMLSLSNDQEAWKMFQVFLPLTELKPNQLRLANYLCRGCGGHPLYIETVAKTFKLNSNKFWADGLDSYRDWPEEDHQGIMEFYKKLQKFCYDQLDDDMKKCFLYGALYPEDRDIYIDYLVECWAAEEFLKRENSYIRGHAILDDFKNVSFEEGKSDEYVRMHKCLRKVALSILSKNECLVKTGEALKGPLDEEAWKQKNWISIVDSGLEKLPDCSCYSLLSTVRNLLANCPNCDKLSTLLLSHNSALTTISPSFFNHKKSLRVLDLSHTGIKSLPPSISRLIKLKVLNLSECKYLMKLEKLEHIESLDLRGSGIIGIPPHLENLGCLRHLRVSFAKSRNENNIQELSFNEDIISKLSSLESLVIDLNSKEQWSNAMAEKIIEEVATLEKFTSLKFSFPNEVVDLIKVMPSPPTLLIYVHEADSLQTFVNKSHSWRNIRGINSFQFFIGCKNSKDPQIPELHLYNRYIKYCDGEGFNALNLEAPADAFELVNHINIKQLSDFPVASMNEIRSFFVKRCKTIETILDTGNHVILQNLEHLYVMDVPNLVSVWKGRMGPGSPSKLETLVLSSCPMLIKIFPDRVIHQLDKIQYLEIKDCSEIQEIILEAEIDDGVQVLPQLKKLTLLNLPKLRSIYPNEEAEFNQSRERLVGDIAVPKRRGQRLLQKSCIVRFLVMQWCCSLDGPMGFFTLNIWSLGSFNAPSVCC
ncbi:hypothetical protein F0562_029084 [Nyssa sinensis]|uniref:Uncharacterized protein n=1 Tax=Nyssa sinensis TaxID=561372 RepID=A0A5J5B2Y3_9ASTE|nr:hypothetical protein F0562_029084 [Nyssa sinensis]